MAAKTITIGLKKDSDKKHSILFKSPQGDSPIQFSVYIPRRILSQLENFDGSKNMKCTFEVIEE